MFVAIRDELGISSFGINIERWPPNATKLLAGPDGLTVLCLGAVPGGKYRPSGPTA